MQRPTVSANGTNVDLPMPQDNDIADMIAAVEANDLITVHLNSTLTKTSGAPGRFSADITTESGRHRDRELRRHHPGLGLERV